MVGFHASWPFAAVQTPLSRKSLQVFASWRTAEHRQYLWMPLRHYADMRNSRHWARCLAKGCRNRLRVDQKGACCEDERGAPQTSAARDSLSPRKTYRSVLKIQSAKNTVFWSTLMSGLLIWNDLLSRPRSLAGALAVARQREPPRSSGNAGAVSGPRRRRTPRALRRRVTLIYGGYRVGARQSTHDSASSRGRAV